MSRDIRRFTARRGFSIEDLEEILDVFGRLRDQERPIIIRVEGIPERKEEKALNVNEQILRLDSEMQNIKNQINRYLKVEIREESVRHFVEAISKIDEVNEVYAYHESDGIVFWIFYDKGDRIDVLEKIVDIECDFEKVFRGLNFDYRILPYSNMNSRIASREELIYRRGA